MKLATRIDTVFLPTLDPTATAEWYRRMFDLFEIFRSPGDDYIGLGFEGDGKAALTLVRNKAIDREAHAPFNLFAPDVEALHAHLVAEGTEVKPIGGQGTLRYFDFRDPSGNWIGVCSFAEGGA